MSGLAEFLKARVAEDIARQQDVWEKWHHRDCEAVPDVLHPGRETGTCDCGVPERVVAEAEAKQQVIFLYEVASGSPELDRDAWQIMRQATLHLALPYASHPDYREEWKP